MKLYFCYGQLIRSAFVSSNNCFKMDTHGSSTNAEPVSMTDGEAQSASTSSVETQSLKLEIDDIKTEEETDLSHKDVMDIVRSSLREILKDPLLCDLPSDVTTEEVNLQVALEHGQAMTVNVRKQNGEILSVVVVQDGTVLDLKKAIKRHVIMKQKRELKITKQISWKYTWRTYWLAFEGQKLDDDNRKIKDYGIRNKDEVTFLKRLKTKGIGY